MIIDFNYQYLGKPNTFGHWFAFIQEPAGAVFALQQSGLNPPRGGGGVWMLVTALIELWGRASQKLKPDGGGGQNFFAVPPSHDLKWNFP